MENEPKVGILGLLWPSKKTQHVDVSALHHNHGTTSINEKNGNGSDSAGSKSPPAEPIRPTVTEEEWINAQRAIRQASGAACFYLITTDVLGPFGLAYSFATVGWV